MADLKFSNNSYFDKTILNRNYLPNISVLINITKGGWNNYTRDAEQIQEDFVEYINSLKGSVPWQCRMVTRTHDS